MYQSPFLGLHEAAHVFADVLRKTSPNTYPDDASALEGGRRELVQALFDGTVRSEGVLSALPPSPPPDQSGPVAVPRPSKWEPIKRGWWSNLRYEKLPCTTPDNTEDFGFDRERLVVLLKATSDSSIVERESSLSQEHQFVFAKYQIDEIVIDWAHDSFEIDESYDRDWSYGGIRVNRADVLSVLGQTTPPDQSITAPSDSQQRPGPLRDGRASTTEVSAPMPALEGRRRGRPPDLRNKVHEWLGMQGSALRGKADTEIADIYCKEELRIYDEDRLRKAVDTHRKHVKTWRLKHS